MASSADSGMHWQVTLMRHKKSKSVLYMEAGKEFVDLLFSFLTLPTSKLLQLIVGLGEDRKRPGTGILNVLDSVRKLPGPGVHAQGKDFVGDALFNLLYPTLYVVLPGHVQRLIKCNQAGEGCGFVAGGTLGYMITNDLCIMRASTANVMLLLAQLNVKSLSDVETCEIGVDSKQALQLLEASIGAISETLLTDIFPAEDQ